MEFERNPLNDFVVALFGHPMAAIGFSLLILIGAALVIVRNWRRFHRPATAALNERLAALSFIEDAESVDESQSAFVDRFSEVDAAMRSGGRDVEELKLAWTQFRETIVDESERPMRATARAEAYFLHLSDDTRILAWWANIFLALGLALTFLGIVAALTSTADALRQGMGAGNGDLTAPLIQLLAITSVKFWTSIAGVLASVILRVFDRRWHAATLRRLEKVAELLDHGTLYSPSQRIAVDQLKELREQSTALRTFSHDLALAIGDNLEKQMQPMISVLGGIQSSIEDFKSGSFNQIGKEFGEALSRQAGTEMAQLGAALTDMTAKLSSMHEHLEGSGRAANEQIAAAARDFAASSDRMNEMFSALSDRVESTGTRLNDAAEGASKAAAEQFAAASAGIQGAFDQMRGEIADYSERLTRGADSAAERNAEVLAKAAAALEGATTRTAEGMGQAIDAAIVRAGEESAKAMTSAFEAFGSRFEEASSGLVETLRSTAGRMEALAAGIERSTSASGEHVGHLTRAGVEAQGMAVALGRAANDIQVAAAPIRSATETIGAAVAQTQNALREQAEAALAQQSSIATIADRLSATSDAATEAWAEYRARFEDVDKALGASIEQIRNASGEHATHLNEQIGRMDNALAGAVDRLSAALEPLTELADQIDDLLGQMKTAA